MFELVVIYEGGEKKIYTYSTEEKAEKAARNIKMACGDQMTWYCVRRAR